MHIKSQKDPSKGVIRKTCPENTQQIYRITPCQRSISIKLQSNFIEITLGHECFPVNLLHIFRKHFYKITYGWLLLKSAEYVTSSVNDFSEGIKHINVKDNVQLYFALLIELILIIKKCHIREYILAYLFNRRNYHIFSRILHVQKRFTLIWVGFSGVCFTLCEGEELQPCLKLVRIR